MRVVVTGGGTGGHIYPALAVARGIKEQDPKADILFVGTARGMEADIVPREGFLFRTVTVEGLTRKVSPRVLLTLLKTSKGCFEAYKILREFKPTVVVGTGGYVCGPVVLSAALLKIPTLIHEQNAYPGITNKLLARLVSKVAVTFPESKKFFSPKANLVVTGLPVRPEIQAANREKAVSALGLDRDKFTVLVVGGSRGARSINKAMVEVIGRAARSENMQVVHMTGRQGFAETMAEIRAAGVDPAAAMNITVRPYLYNMDEALAAADLVVCRAGATTIAEVTVRGLPAVLIPYPYASDNHQEYNARSLADNGAAVMILDRDLTGHGLWETIRSLSQHRPGLSAMAACSKKLGKPEALEDLVQIVRWLSATKTPTS